MRNPMSPAAARTTACLCVTVVALAACSPAPAYYGPPPSPGYASVTVITVPPPDLPVYEQPPCPADGYLWTPGYWAWADGGYYWVPGTWVEAPQPGYVWTPGYWGWGGNAYVYHQGYWGTQVGFYGGVNYGYGYPGHGYEGGRWDNGHYYYNRSVNNVNVTVVHNVYNTTVINNTRTVTRVSYNGGNGGIQERATAEEESAGRGPHMAPIAAQTHHVDEARADPQLRVSRTRASRRSPQRPGPVRSPKPVSCPRGREAPCTTVLRSRTTLARGPMPRSMRPNFRQSNIPPRPTRAIRSGIRNTSRIRRSWSPNRRRNVSSSSKSRIRTTSG